MPEIKVQHVVSCSSEDKVKSEENCARFYKTAFYLQIQFPKHSGCFPYHMQARGQRGMIPVTE